MATSQDYFEYILELLREVNGVSHRKMMGEYILYCHGVIFGGVYDNRFLIKKTKTNAQYNLKEALPYPGGSVMYVIDSEDPDEVKEIVLKTILGLK